MKKYNELHPRFETWTDFYKMAKDKISMNDPNIKEITYHHREDFKDEEIVTYCITIDFMKARVFEEFETNYKKLSAEFDPYEFSHSISPGYLIAQLNELMGYDPHKER
jgi:hypothetical protein